MAKLNSAAEERREAIRTSLAFNDVTLAGDLRKHVPRGEPNTTLHRRATLDMVLPTAQEASQSETLANDNQLEDAGEQSEDELDQATFVEKISHHLKDVVFEITQEEMEREFTQRADYIIDRLFHAQRGLLLPFGPLTKAGQQAFSDDYPSVKTIDVDDFKQLAETDPAALYEEFARRDIGRMIWQAITDELHTTATSASKNLEAVHSWADFFAKMTVVLENELNGGQGGDDDEDSAAILQDAIQKYEDTEKARQAEKTKRQTVEKEKAALQTEVQRLKLQLRSSTPGSTTTSASGDKRSAKIPDPPKYTNSSTDKESFEVWEGMVKDKLAINFDHYPTDEAKFVFIKSCLGGAAAEDLQPYLRTTHPEQLTTSDALLKHLHDEYFDPNIKERADQEFAELKWNSLDKDKKRLMHQAFRTKFVRLAGETELPKKKWKYEYKKRLSQSLQLALMSAYIDDSVTFEKYAQQAAQSSLTMENTQAARSRGGDASSDNNSMGGRGAYNNRGRGNNRDGRGGRGGGRGGSNNNGQRDKSPATLRRLFREKKCFKCEKTGHFGTDCPNSVNQTEGVTPSDMDLMAMYNKMWNSSGLSSNKEKLGLDSEEEND
jgi:hypothetical protein